MDKVIVAIVVVVVVLGAGFFIWQSTIPQAPAKPVVVPAGNLFFYGQECPHCQKVEQWMTDNNIEAKVPMTKLEVWHNADNAAILAKVASMCGIASAQVGVPLLYDGQKCYVGEVEVPNQLKIMAGIK